jgi:hypothetical protein
MRQEVMMICASINIELMSFDQLVDRIKELKNQYPKGTEVTGSADLSFYFKKEEGGAQ